MTTMRTSTTPAAAPNDKWVTVSASDAARPIVAFICNDNITGELNWLFFWGCQGNWCILYFEISHFHRYFVLFFISIILRSGSSPDLNIIMSYSHNNMQIAKKNSEMWKLLSNHSVILVRSALFFCSVFYTYNFIANSACGAYDAINNALGQNVRITKFKKFI